jgi:hypothetical protein
MLLPGADIALLTPINKLCKETYEIKENLKIRENILNVKQCKP